MLNVAISLLLSSIAMLNITISLLLSSVDNNAEHHNIVVAVKGLKMIICVFLINPMMKKIIF